MKKINLPRLGFVSKFIEQNFPATPVKLIDSEAYYFLEPLPCKGKARGVVLAVHGLNQNPEALKPLLNDYCEKGLRCFLLHLPGHLRQGFDNRLVTKDLIYRAYSRAYQELRAMSENEDIPLGFLGYSFGGLIGARFFAECSYDRVVFLAPALNVRLFTHGLRPLLPFLSKIVSIPLGDEEMEVHYRFHKKGVPKAVYRSFFNIYDDFQRLLKMRQEKLPKDALVFCHPLDELISYRRLKSGLVKKNNWQLFPISNREADFKRYKHLIFDRVTLGENCYGSLLEKTSSFYISS